MFHGYRPCAPVARLCALLLLAPSDTWAISDEVKDTFVAIHNIYRCMHGVRKAVWDDALSAGAESFANGEAYDPKKKAIGSDPAVASSKFGSNAYLLNNRGEAEEDHVRESMAAFYYPIKLYDGTKWSPQVADDAKRASGNLGGEYDFMPLLGALLWSTHADSIDYKIGCGTAVKENNTVIVCRYLSPTPCIPNGKGQWVNCFPNTPTVVKDYATCASEMEYDNHVQQPPPKNGLLNFGEGDGGGSEGTPTWVWIVLAICIIVFLLCCCAICLGFAYWHKKRKEKEQAYANNYNNRRSNAVPPEESQAPGDDWNQSRSPQRKRRTKKRKG